MVMYVVVGCMHGLKEECKLTLDSLTHRNPLKAGVKAAMSIARLYHLQRCLLWMTFMILDNTLEVLSCLWGTGS